MTPMSDPLYFDVIFSFTVFCNYPLSNSTLLVLVLICVFTGNNITR